MQIATHVARQGKNVLVFSLEMPATQLVQRMFCNAGRVDFNHFRRGRLEEDELGRVMEAANEFENLPFWIEDTPGVAIADIGARARRIEAQHGEIGLIVVDYLQLIQAGAGKGSTADAIAQISKGLRIIARERNCALMALSQVSRGVESREDKRPVLSDLRDGGGIEAEATEVICLYNDDHYRQRAAAEPSRSSNNDFDQSYGESRGITEAIVRKQRNGELGTVRLKWTGNHVRFDNLERHLQPGEEDEDSAPSYGPVLRRDWAVGRQWPEPICSARNAERDDLSETTNQKNVGPVLKPLLAAVMKAIFEPAPLSGKTIYHVGISGGKDSTALLLWMVYESGIPHDQIDATFSDTGNEHEWTYWYVRFLSKNVFPIKWLKPELDFYELARKKKRFPSQVARFALNISK